MLRTSALVGVVVGGLDRVYEIGRDFRNEGIDRQHNPEFSMLEFYEAFGDFETMIGRTEALLAHVVMAARGTLSVSYGGATLDFHAPFRRIGYFEAIREALGEEHPGEHPLPGAGMSPIGRPSSR